MDADAFRLMASHEDHHWWFVGRRAVIDAILDRATLPPGASVLEAGCGTGGNLYLLERRGRVAAFEPSFEARELASEKHGRGVEVRSGELPHDLPFETEAFDLVVALDVLEHIRPDGDALAALVSLARPGGWILVTVPAHPVLWGAHDRRLHHVRRYRRSGLRRICDASGAQVVFTTAFNSILAPLAVTLRLAERVLPISFGNQERMPPRAINRILAAAFSLEGTIVRRTGLRFGLSYAVLLRRPIQATAGASIIGQSRIE
jgi:SAM-dependent methyltransferase